MRPVAPLLTGPLLNVALGVPFVVAGARQSVYDVALYVMFRNMRSAAESERAAPAELADVRDTP